MLLRWINSVAMIIGSNLNYVAKCNTTSGCKKHAIKASLFQSELSRPARRRVTIRMKRLMRIQMPVAIQGKASCMCSLSVARHNLTA